jgi:hypothetical protein
MTCLTKGKNRDKERRLEILPNLSSGLFQEGKPKEEGVFVS